MTGIEPAYSAWEADVLPLNYIGRVSNGKANTGETSPGVRSDRRSGPRDDLRAHQTRSPRQSTDTEGSGVIGTVTEVVAVAPLESVAVMTNVSSCGFVLNPPGPVA